MTDLTKVAQSLMEFNGFLKELYLIWKPEKFNLDLEPTEWSIKFNRFIYTVWIDNDVKVQITCDLVGNIGYFSITSRLMIKEWNGKTWDEAEEQGLASITIKPDGRLRSFHYIRDETLPRHFEKWLPVIRRNAYLTGCNIEASEHERLEWSLWLKERRERS